MWAGRRPSAALAAGRAPSDDHRRHAAPGRRARNEGDHAADRRRGRRGRRHHLPRLHRQGGADPGRGGHGVGPGSAAGRDRPHRPHRAPTGAPPAAHRDPAAPADRHHQPAHRRRPALPARRHRRASGPGTPDERADLPRDRTRAGARPAPVPLPGPGGRAPPAAADVLRFPLHDHRRSPAHPGADCLRPAGRRAPPSQPPSRDRNGGRPMLMRLVRSYLRPYVRPLTAVVALQLVGTMASLYLPSLNADIIDKGIARGDTGYIVRIGGWMLLVSGVQIACSIVAVYFGARTAMSFGRDVRAALFRQVGELSGREVARFGAPSLITRNTNDVQQVQMLVVLTCTIMVAAPIMCIGGVIMALRQDVGLSWLMLLSVPVLVTAIGLIIRRMVPQFRLMQTRIDIVNRVLREQIAGVRVVRAFVREPYETDRFGRANANLTDTALRVGRLTALFFPLVLLVVNASSVAVLWFGAARVDAGQIQVGALTAFLMYLMQILMSVMMATFMLIMVPRAAVSAERIVEVLDTETSVTTPANPVTEVSGRGELEMRNVAFQYPGAAEPVLHDVSFRATAGQTTAIIGSTGAGKTTLLSLVPRQFDPEVLWSRIGIVPQKPYLFTGTVASNLRYGNPDATDEELWEHLEIAQARDFVEAMPGGLEAPISQGGTNVSGGQRQRLAIARALVRRPEIYLFDDSFSSLDLGTDARLRAALRPITADATTIIVGQRVSTIIDADQIIVLENGAIVGIGRHGRPWKITR